MSYRSLRMASVRSDENRRGVPSDKPGNGEVSSDEEDDRGVPSNKPDRGGFSSDENEDEGVSSA
jgi:hypothetical protein